MTQLKQNKKVPRVNYHMNKKRHSNNNVKSTKRTHSNFVTTHKKFPRNKHVTSIKAPKTNLKFFSRKLASGVQAFQHKCISGSFDKHQQLRKLMTINEIIDTCKNIESSLNKAKAIMISNHVWINKKDAQAQFVKSEVKKALRSRLFSSEPSFTHSSGRHKTVNIHHFDKTQTSHFNENPHTSVSTHNFTCCPHKSGHSGTTKKTTCPSSKPHHTSTTTDSCSSPFMYPYNDPHFETAHSAEVIDAEFDATTPGHIFSIPVTDNNIAHETHNVRLPSPTKIYLPKKSSIHFLHHRSIMIPSPTLTPSTTYQQTIRCHHLNLIHSIHHHLSSIRHHQLQPLITHQLYLHQLQQLNVVTHSFAVSLIPLQSPTIHNLHLPLVILLPIIHHLINNQQQIYQRLMIQHLTH